jgi:hypothetical protein
MLIIAWRMSPHLANLQEKVGAFVNAGWSVYSTWLAAVSSAARQSILSFYE